MDLDEPGWPLIDDFFLGLAEGRRPETARRYARVRHRLYDFLDTDDMRQWLDPDEATLLAAEREFAREGAVRAVVDLEGLLRCLPGFVGEEPLPTGDAEARMQISVVGRLVVHVRDDHLAPGEHQQSVAVATRAVRRARLAVDTRHDDPALQVTLDQINDRFKQQPGPQW